MDWTGSTVRSTGRKKGWSDLSDRDRLQHRQSLAGRFIFFFLWGIVEASSKLTGNHLKRKVVVALLTWKYFFEISIFSCELLKPGFPKCPSGMCGTPGYMCWCGLQDLWPPGTAVALKAPIRSIISEQMSYTVFHKAWTLDSFRFHTEFVSRSWWLKQTQYYFVNLLKFSNVCGKNSIINCHIPISPAWTVTNILPILFIHPLSIFSETF